MAQRSSKLLPQEHRNIWAKLSSKEAQGRYNINESGNQWNKKDTENSVKQNLILWNDQYNSQTLADWPKKWHKLPLLIIKQHISLETLYIWIGQKKTQTTLKTWRWQFRWSRQIPQKRQIKTNNPI